MLHTPKSLTLFSMEYLVTIWNDELVDDLVCYTWYFGFFHRLGIDRSCTSLRNVTGGESKTWPTQTKTRKPIWSGNVCANSLWVMRSRMMRVKLNNDLIADNLTYISDWGCVSKHVFLTILPPNDSIVWCKIWVRILHCAMTVYLTIACKKVNWF